MLLLCHGGIYMPQILPIRDLRDTNNISNLCHQEKEPIFITKNGYGDMVIMSIETYEQIINYYIDKSIEIAEKEIEEGGELLDAKESLKMLKRKHFG